MLIFQSIILGLVQALTEFLPISSSGHLILIPKLFGWNVQSLAFDTVLHLGTAFALLVYFYTDIKLLCTSFARDVLKSKLMFNEFSDLGKFGLYVLVGSIPAGILGVLLGDFIENSFRDVKSVVAFSILGTVIMFIAEKFSIYSINVLNLKKSFLIGLFQSLALFPGVSRSGATISAGMLFGLTREEAARFSFLLSVPIVLAASLFKILSTGEELIMQPLVITLAGLVTSFVGGLLVIKFLMKFLKTNSLYIFIGYRIILALGLILLL